MEQYKKKTLALVLASVVTVIGAFGADNYKNSLMSIDFEQTQDRVVRMNLFTKLPFNENLDIVKTDADTYVITLPETNNEVLQNYKIGGYVRSVDIKTVPYTTEHSGSTKLTIKTYDNAPVFPKTRLYIPAENQKQLGSSGHTQNAPQVPADLPAPPPVSPVTPDNSLNQPQSVNIQDSVKQFQPSAPAAPAEVKPAEPLPAEAAPLPMPEESSGGRGELLSWVLGIALFLALVIFFLVKAKDKMAEVIGEQTAYDVSDEPDKKKEKNSKKTRTSSSINTTISKIDKKYSKPVKMPVTPPISEPASREDEENEQEVETNVVDLDELLQEKNNAAGLTAPDAADNNSEDDECNASLEEFLSAYDFSDADEFAAAAADKNLPEEPEEAETFDEEFYEECIKDDKLQFSKDDIKKIETLMSSEISDDTRRNAPKILPSSAKHKKPSPLDLLENFVTIYAVQQNISFSKDDVDALFKLMNVELDRSFITDLKTDPVRMKQMQDEIIRQKSKPHKTSELLTLNVKDMLPDLSEALKKQGGRRIESEVTPQVVYYSEGYDVSTLKLTDDLPDLSKELDNDDAYKVRPSDEIEYVDTSYDVQKMSIADELPDLQDALENPEKYETSEPELEIADEETLLKNISNVTFKPFDDGSREFEVLNKPEDEPTDINDSLEDFADSLNESSTDDELEAFYNETGLNEENNLTDNLDSGSGEINAKEDLDSLDTGSLSEAERLIKTIQEKERRKNAEKITAAAKEEAQTEKTDNKPEQAPLPEFCVLDGERFSIISRSDFTDKMGCYLAKNEQGYCIIGFVGEKIFKIKNYEKLKTEKLQARVSEKLDNGTLRYLVRIGIHKFVLNVNNENMEFVMDLC